MNRDCVGGEAECEIGQLSELGGVFAPTHATPFGSAVSWSAPCGAAHLISTSDLAGWTTTDLHDYL